MTGRDDTRMKKTEKDVIRIGIIRKERQEIRMTEKGAIKMTEKGDIMMTETVMIIMMKSGIVNILTGTAVAEMVRTPKMKRVPGDTKITPIRNLGPNTKKTCLLHLRKFISIYTL